MRSLVARLAIGLGCWLVAVATVPRLACGWDADRWFEGDLPTQDALGQSVAASVLAHRERKLYRTKHSRFDGQSAIAVYQMTILGLGQIALAHPEKRGAYLPAMRSAAARLVDPRTLDYAAKVYGHSGLSYMAPGEGHAYLGYVNLALGMLRAVDPHTKYAALNDRLSRAFAQRLAASPTGMIETYPGETWPPDVAAVAGSVGLNARVTGVDRAALLSKWSKRYGKCAIDESGYLVQRVRSGSCRPVDAPRGSGTAVASYFIAFADRALSQRLEAALAGTGRRTLFGFGGLREYAPGMTGSGDVNAGPIVFGVSVGATGFGIGAARTNGDRDLYRQLYRTADLFGAPASGKTGKSFVTGGALGNALLLAMLTARRP